MYIKSMHEFVVKYDMVESVEEESLMRGFQRWRKKMKKFEEYFSIIYILGGFLIPICIVLLI